MSPASEAAPASPGLTGPEARFARRAIRRDRLFVALSIAGIAVAAGLAAYYAYRRLHDPTFPIGARVALILLILLNARQNLRQHRYAVLLRKLLPAAAPERPPAGPPAG